LSDSGTSGGALPSGAPVQGPGRGHVGTPLGRPQSPPLGRSGAPREGRPSDSAPPRGRSDRPPPERRRRSGGRPPPKPPQPPPEPIGEIPKYIQACDLNPRRKQSFWVYTWRLDNPSMVTRRPYTCNSWRCPYGCATHQSHVLFARLEQAFDGVPLEEIVFLVLTFPGIEHGRRGKSLQELYRQISTAQRKLQKRWRRLLERDGGEDFKSRWVAVVEQHASGVPHLNVLIHSRSLANEVIASKRALLMTGASKKLREHLMITGRWLDHVMDSGFGEHSSWDIAEHDRAAGHSRQKVFSYLAAVAKRADRTHRELAKKSQLPLVAPKGFRRVRSGRHFLPPKNKNPNVSGTIVLRRRSREGDEEVFPLVRSQRPDYQAQVTAICDLEQRLAWDDEARMSERARLKRLGLPLEMADGPRVTLHRIKIEIPPSRAPPEPPTDPPELDRLEEEAIAAE
jgi:hypothetical protein